MEYDTMFNSMLPTDTKNKDALRQHFISATLATHIRKITQTSNQACYAFSICFTTDRQVNTKSDNDIEPKLPINKIQHMCNLNWLLVITKVDKLMLSISGTRSDVYKYYYALLQRLEPLQVQANDFLYWLCDEKKYTLTSTISKPMPSTGSINGFITTGYVRILTDALIKLYTEPYISLDETEQVNGKASPYLQAALWLEHESAYFTTLTSNVSKCKITPAYSEFIEKCVTQYYDRYNDNVNPTITLGPNPITTVHTGTTQTLTWGTRHIEVHYSEHSAHKTTILTPQVNNTKWPTKYLFVLDVFIDADKIKTAYNLNKQISLIKYNKKKFSYHGITKMEHNPHVVDKNNYYRIQFVTDTTDDMAKGDFHRCRVESVITTEGDTITGPVTYIFETGERLIVGDKLTRSDNNVDIISFRTASGELLTVGQKIRLQVQRPARPPIDITCNVRGENS